MHYFFVPKHLPWLNSIVLIDNDKNIVIEFFVCSLLAILVIALTLGVIRLIQESTFFNFLMFGKETYSNHKRR